MPKSQEIFLNSLLKLTLYETIFPGDSNEPKFVKFQACSSEQWQHQQIENQQGLHVTTLKILQNQTGFSGS